MVYTCLRISIPLLDVERLRLLEASLLTKASCRQLDLVLEATRQQSLLLIGRPPSSSLGKRDRDAHSQRAKAQSTITEWFSSNAPMWMGGEDELSDAEWCCRIIEVVSRNLSG